MKLQNLFLSILAIATLSACSDNKTPVDTTPSTLGSSSAKIIIEEFSDVQCPACGNISPQVEKIVRANSDIAQMKYYHYPLSQHQYAFIGAEATECAADQGKFWEYLETIFDNQSSLNEDLLYTIAKNLELDETAFRTCLDSHDKKAKVTAHMREGNRRRVNATPTIFVNGNKVKWSGAETFEAYIKSLAQ